MSAKVSMRLPSIVEDQILGQEAGLLGGAAGLNRLDPGLDDLTAAEIVEAREDRDRQDEIGDRPCRHDGGALGDALVGKLMARSLGRHLGELALIRNARGVEIADELHVAAEGNRRHLPARAVPVGPAERAPCRTRSRRP